LSFSAKTFDVNPSEALTILCELGGRGFVLLIIRKLSPERGKAFYMKFGDPKNDA
jgi:hypothetical protein